jgi:hypothetical protein
VITAPNFKRVWWCECGSGNQGNVFSGGYGGGLGEGLGCGRNEGFGCGREDSDYGNGYAWCTVLLNPTFLERMGVE